MNLSLKATGDALTVSGMAGIFIDHKKNTYFIGVDAKATALSGRVGGQLDIFGLQVETGLSDAVKDYLDIDVFADAILCDIRFKGRSTSACICRNSSS